MFMAQDSGLRAQGSGRVAQGAGLKVQGSGHKITAQDSGRMGGFKFQGQWRIVYGPASFALLNVAALAAAFSAALAKAFE